MAELENKSRNTLSSSPLGGEPNRVAPTSQNNVKPKPRFGGGYYYQPNTLHAKKMRKDLTPWELQLWLRLKGKQLAGHKFRRQQPVGRYIVDFLNVEKKLVIELDGSQHVDSAEDKRRDEYMTREGYRVLRFWNNEVNADIEAVLSQILNALRDTPHRNAEEAFRLPPKGGATELASRQEFPREYSTSGEVKNSMRNILRSSLLGGEPPERSERGDPKSNAEPNPSWDLVGCNEVTIMEGKA